MPDYFYLKDENEVIMRQNSHLYVKKDGEWVQTYEYGGIYSGDIPYKRITKAEADKLLNEKANG